MNGNDAGFIFSSDSDKEIDRTSSMPLTGFKPTKGRISGADVKWNLVDGARVSLMRQVY